MPDVTNRDATRIPVLDGIRGLAIILVVLGHCTPSEALSTRLTEWTKKAALGGWIGVDLFFVLSGFLITGILLRANASPHYFRNFYIRRFLRIWPLYLFVAIMLFLIVPPLLSTADQSAWSKLAAHQEWIWLHCANYGMYLYAADFRGSPIGVTHLWSLAVEEHYYLLWPVAVYVLSLNRLRVLCLAIISMALAFRTVAVLGNYEPFYFTLTHCRIDALALGSALSTYAFEGRLQELRPMARLGGFVATAALAVYFVTQKGFWPWHPFMFSIGLTMVMVVWASLLVLTVGEENHLSRLLQSRALQSAGKYSYAWYIFHGALGGMIDRLIPSWAALASSYRSPEAASITILLLRGGLSLGIAILSWHILEKHCLQFKRYFPAQVAESTGVAGVVST